MTKVPESRTFIPPNLLPELWRPYLPTPVIQEQEEPYLLNSDVMNVWIPFRNLLRGAGLRKKETEQPAQATTDTFKQLLLSLQQVCGKLPEGEVFLVQGDGEFTVSLTWTPTTDTNPEKHLFSLDGKGEVTEWTEEKPDGVVDPRMRILPQTVVSKANTVKDASEKEVGPPSKQQRMLQQLDRYLRLHYAFRYNRLTDRTECARLNPDALDDFHHLVYTPVDDRTLNGIALVALDEGIACWDRDVKRYIESDRVQAYHPFTLYFDRLPEWDGKDRVTDLAKRVSGKALWISSFHRWLLAATAGWMHFGEESHRANSVAPILVSTQQGWGKSTFCRMLLPEPLQEYFTESFDLNRASGSESKLASFGLINLDEFDRLPATRMPQLKNLMQLESLHIRRAYKRNTEPLPRIASFMGTSNRRDLLTDLSGSRRFLCVELEHPIDCITPVEYDQLYAQLKHELANGARYWFSKEEEAAIQESNRSFYRVTPAEELVSSCFRFAEAGEEGARLMSAADIYAVIRRKNPAALRDCTCTTFSRLLAQLGRRVHTKYGNGYWVKGIR